MTCSHYMLLVLLLWDMGQFEIALLGDSKGSAFELKSTSRHKGRNRAYLSSFSTWIYKDLLHLSQTYFSNLTATAEPHDDTAKNDCQHQLFI